MLLIVVCDSVLYVDSYAFYLHASTLVVKVNNVWR